MAIRQIQGMRSIVTGASSGIGREIARQLSRHGAPVILTARRTERLQDLCDELRSQGGDADWIDGDITSPDVRRRIAERARLRWGAVDLLINNAGIGAVGPFALADERRLRRVMEVNFFAPLELTRSCLPLLRAGRSPLIVNVGSVLGHRAVPSKSEYCASKFAMHGFSDALRAELARDGIDVLLVSPSTTQTEFFSHTVNGENKDTPRSTRFAAPARSVADRMLRAIRRGSHEIILSPGGILLVWLDRLCPPLANLLVARFG